MITIVNPHIIILATGFVIIVCIATIVCMTVGKK